MTLEQYYDLLEKHDWTYQYSDDHNIWSRGQAEAEKLKQGSLLGWKYERLLLDYNEYVWGKAPKPKRP